MRRRAQKWTFRGVVGCLLIAAGLIGGVCNYIDNHRPRSIGRNLYGVAVMPDSKVQPEVRDLKDQQSGWITPWAVQVTESGSCWLDARAAVYPDKMGTARLYVTHDARKGFIVRSYDRHYKWDRVPDSQIDGHYPVWSFTY